MLKNKRGITLIALIITIIVLLILAGISITTLTGENSILNRRTEEKQSTEPSQLKSKVHLAYTAALANGKGVLTQENFEAELAKEFGTKGVDWSIADGTDENEQAVWEITVGNNAPIQILKASSSGSGSSGNESSSGSGSGVVTPTTTSVADATTTFSTKYGKIDVIWLSGTGKTVSSTPNAPNLSGMTPVSWTKSGNTWTEDSTASVSYYSYTAGTGSSDNTSSRWANAKNSDGSYFVWIPRFAYRITYYSSQSSTEPTGYYDGWGQWRASDGSVRLALDSGIETVEHGGNKYIVHPAFCGTSVGYDNGSWSSDISGFWVAKYEMSRNGATASNAGSGYSTTFKSIPSVQSARNITIGNMYNVAKSYDTSKESHLMKNSEWGAVAYLTQSQYGRNGNEIDINNSSSCITGIGGGSTSASEATGTTNAYNTTIGAKASTTGNVYGVYDMSGGASEYVAAFNNTDSNGYISSNGWSGLTTDSASDKYATKYLNTSSKCGENNITYTYGKIGDATKEVNKGGAQNLTNTGYYKNWFSGDSDFPSLTNPFFKRGGYFYSGRGAGVFFLSDGSGRAYNYNGFRVVAL